MTQILPPPTTPPTAEQLLIRTREQVRGVIGLSYLIYTLIIWQMDIAAPSSMLHSARSWGIVTAIATLILNQLGMLRRAWVSTLTHAALLPVMWVITAQTLISKASPSLLLMWVTFVVLGLFLVLGTVFGGILTGVLCVGILALLVLYPVSPEHYLAWVTGGVVLLGTALLGLLTIRFIEKNIVLHDEATDKLRAAQLDALTGIPGRAALEENMRRSAAHAQKSKTPFSIILTDIDHFKQVNDQHGHNTGDEVLKSFSKRLHRNLRSSGGVVGRWGGEEFLVLLPGVSRTDALAVAERLRNEITLSPLSGLNITASFGVASYRAAEDDELEQLVARADERLYEAKKAGRNTVR